MKIETREYSKEAWGEAFSLGTLAFYFLQVAAVGFASLKASEKIGANQEQSLVCVIVGVVGYLAYVIAKMSSVDVATANARAEIAEASAAAVIEQAEKSERYAEVLQLLKAKTQTLLEEKQTLSEKLQTLESQFSDLSIRNAELDRSLESEKANATKRIEQAQADAEDRALKEVAPYMEKAKTLENRAKTAETKLALLEEAIGYKRKAASANGRMSQAGSNEEAKANAKSERDNYLAQYNAALKANIFLYEVLEAKG